VSLGGLGSNHAQYIFVMLTFIETSVEDVANNYDRVIVNIELGIISMDRTCRIQVFDESHVFCTPKEVPHLLQLPCYVDHALFRFGHHGENGPNMRSNFSPSRAPTTRWVFQCTGVAWWEDKFTRHKMLQWSVKRRRIGVRGSKGCRSRSAGGLAMSTEGLAVLGSTRNCNMKSRVDGKYEKKKLSQEGAVGNFWMSSRDGCRCSTDSAGYCWQNTQNLGSA